MDSIRLRNFRCFRDEQTARLAPLTLLVGDNSTGKTSFMAMIRALWDVAYVHRVPDFKEDPYDLGSFDDIAHHRGSRGGRAETFEAGFETAPRRREAVEDAAKRAGPDRFAVVFEREGTVPIPALRRVEHDDLWVEERLSKGVHREFRIGTSQGAWMCTPDVRQSRSDKLQYTMLPLLSSIASHILSHEKNDKQKVIPLKNSSKITDKDLSRFGEILLGTGLGGFRSPTERPYASAPVRSRPRRTYDPARAVSDPEGDHVPMYLASMYSQDKPGWTAMKKELEAFGQASGLFNEIDIRRLGTSGSEPFQLRIRKFGDRLKGPPRNMIDVGYGVSQVLPVIAELLRRDAPSMFLLQQPEVHLHPSAQAELGSLFCRIAEPDRRLVVETHSDHLLDRVRMDVRDKRGRLKPDDVSILFFERDDLDVRIHSIGLDGEGNVFELDGEGNVLRAPESYRAFFMEETWRSLGF